MNSWKNHFEAMLHMGTPECGILCAVIGVLLALSILIFGFGGTLLILFMGFAGAIIGGVKDKEELLKLVLNRIIPNPDRQDEEDEPKKSE